MIKNMYKRKNLYRTLGIVSMFTTPFPGVGLGLLIQAGIMDSRIKKKAIENEKKLTT